MTSRHLLDLRAGTPWTDAHLAVFTAAARGGWGDPRHPSSEGRRAATWLEAAESTVRSLSGYRHVAFLPNRATALAAALQPHGDAPRTAAATHRREVLAQCGTALAVDDQGLVTWQGDGVAVVQAANEETGVIDPLPERMPYVLDASNAFGRTEALPHGASVIADASAWGAPGGLAFLLSDDPLPPTPPPPIALIALAVQALTDVWSTRGERERQTAAAVDAFEASVSATIPDVQFHGHRRIAHIRSFSVLHLDAETLTRALDAAGYVVGSGSACVADGTPSHVLAAMGVVTHGNVRIALPVSTEPSVLDGFATVLADTVHRLRVEAGVADL